MKILLTGVAGFIGAHVCNALLERGDNVVGIDNLNPYYDPELKRARLKFLMPYAGFEFIQADITDAFSMNGIFTTHAPEAVIHLAAQAGVRYSLENPQAYIDTNITGHLNILEACRHVKGLKHFVYASSSSVYGGNVKQPFSTDDPTDAPVSPYAVTKKTNELMTGCYAHLYGFPATGLRFFTIYGPWGRPDMTPYVFADAMRLANPIRIFNNGDMKRDFTYIDDAVKGVLAALDKPPVQGVRSGVHRVYNIGNNNPENLLDYIAELEKAMGFTAKKEMAHMQAGDVAETYADITATQNDLGFEPTTTIRDGIAKFAQWYKDYYKM